MDFLDPQKQRRHAIRLLVGYALIGVAIVIGTTVLLYQSYGFGFGKNGKVIQSGLVFVSSQPGGAQIRLNGVLNKARTNARLTLPAGQYALTLNRQDYRTWQRQITVAGGDVQHFDYPFLFPKNLVTTKQASYTAAPALASQSPDQRWLLIQSAATQAAFDLYDLRSAKPITTSLSLPAALVSKATTAQSWQVVQWANDNQHVLLQHVYDGKFEYLLLDRQNPDLSVNLTKTLSITAGAVVSLINNQYDQYYIFDAAAQTLDSASLKTPDLTPVLQHVLAYKSYGTSTILYATTTGAASGKVAVDVLADGTANLLRQVAPSTSYLLNMATYNGTLYVLLGATSENQVYIYKNPLRQLSAGQPLPTAIRSLLVTNPNYLSFSPNAQFISVEGGNQFAVYDLQSGRVYNYVTAAGLDLPQLHAAWMDGDRLTYVSGGKLLVFDYDQANPQTLVAAAPAYLPFFSADYHYLYTLAPNATNGLDLFQTPLLTPADL